MSTEPTSSESADNDRASVSDCLAASYKSLVRINNLFEKQDINAGHIDQCEAFAESFLDTLIKYPGPVLAQLHFNKSNLPYYHNFQFNCLTFCGLLLLRNHCNLTTAQQILAGVLSWCVTAKNTISTLSESTETKGQCNFEKVKTQLIRALGHYQRQIWLEVLTGVPGNCLKNPLQHLQKRNIETPATDFLSLSVAMASLITRKADHSGINYSKALLKLAQNSHSFAQPLLEQVIHYPGVILPGCTLILSGQQKLLFLGRHQNELYGRAWSPSQKRYSEEITAISESQVKGILSPGNLNSLKVFDKWWGEQWQEVQALNHTSDSNKLYARGFRLDKPPGSLLQVIEHLNAQDIEIDKLTQLVENDPNFAQHIQVTASQQSRAKLRIDSVKHGLLMHGFERTRSVLVEKALTSRINQHAFPLQDALYQFLKLWAAFAASIAQRHPRLLPEEASCWVHFAASGLFTHPELKLKQHWQCIDNENNRDGIKIQVKQSPLLWQHAWKLATAWAQDKALREALRDAPAKQPLPPTARRSRTLSLLNLSLSLASSMFFNGRLPAFDSDEYLQQYCANLGIKADDFRDICDETVKNSHNYWPMANKCHFENG